MGNRRLFRQNPANVQLLKYDSDGILEYLMDLFDYFAWGPVLGSEFKERGLSDGSASQELTTEHPYVIPDSWTVRVGGQVWDEVDDITMSGPDDEHFEIEYEDDTHLIIRFGDDANGKIPPDGDELYIEYQTHREVEIPQIPVIEPGEEWVDWPGWIPFVQSIVTFSDPDECPEALLPYLATMLGVKLYDALLDTRTLRQHIKDRIPFARTKATTRSVEIFFRSLGWRATVKELWVDPTLAVPDPLLGPGHYTIDPDTFSDADLPPGPAWRKHSRIDIYLEKIVPVPDMLLHLTYLLDMFRQILPIHLLVRETVIGLFFEDEWSFPFDDEYSGELFYDNFNSDVFEPIHLIKAWPPLMHDGLVLTDRTGAIVDEWGVPFDRLGAWVDWRVYPISEPGCPPGDPPFWWIPDQLECEAHGSFSDTMPYALFHDGVVIDGITGFRDGTYDRSGAYIHLTDQLVIEPFFLGAPQPPLTY